MRKRVLSALAAMVLLCSASIQACVLRMAAETDFPPHLILREQGWQGQSVELLQLLAKEVGCELVFVNSPWLRSLAQLKSGELDLVSHLSYSDARKADFAFIGPHHIESIWLIGDPSKLPKIEQLNDLSDKVDLGRIAKLNGAYYGEQFELLEQKPFLPDNWLVSAVFRTNLRCWRRAESMQFWRISQYCIIGKHISIKMLKITRL